MELKDEIRINAPKDVVYAALNDPEVLRQCIPGCEELVKHSDTDLEAKVVLKVGPVKARFGGTVVLDTTGAPDAFSLTGQGNGGAAGHAKGGADVTLEEVDGVTILRWRHHPALRRQGRNRRQAGAAWLASDPEHGQETGGQLFHQVRRGG